MDKKELKWYMDNIGKVSTLRILAVLAFSIGTTVILCGIVCFILCIVAMFMKIENFHSGLMNSLGVITAGCGVIAFSNIAKAWQKQAEVKNGSNN